MRRHFYVGLSRRFFFALNASFCLLFNLSETFAQTETIKQIRIIAEASGCAKYNWKDRGLAPKAYMSGMAVTYGKSLCRLRNNQKVAVNMGLKNGQNTEKDAIAHYEPRFDQLKLPIDVSGKETLRSLYTLGIGLGMRESSGKFCEGYDVKAGANRDPIEIEAGLFQTSSNSMHNSDDLRKLFTDYKAGKTKCHLDVFSPGVSCPVRGIVGSGEAAEFQKLAKTCPAFATEFAMSTLRVVRKHYGPINRQEAEVIAVCNDMLDQVQAYIEAKPAMHCTNLL